MRIILLITLLFSFLYYSDAQNINVYFDDSGVLFKEGNNSILFYNTINKSLNGLDSRSNFIHPLYGLNGEVLTENYPEDHLHHRGIFWAWHQLYIGDKRIGDGWDMNDIRYEVDSVWVTNIQDSNTTIASKVFWKSPLWLDNNNNEIPIIREYTEISVYKKTTNYRIIDVSINLMALEKDVKIGGSEDNKGYGGFSYRIKLAPNMQFTSSTGIVEPNNLPVLAGDWMDISGAIGKDNKLIGFTIMCHPSNPKPVNRWILRKSRSMQNAVYPFPGANAVLISNTKPVQLKYRMIIHNGGVKDVNIRDIYNNYIDH